MGERLMSHSSAIRMTTISVANKMVKNRICRSCSVNVIRFLTQERMAWRQSLQPPARAHGSATGERLTNQNNSAITTAMTLVRNTVKKNICR